MNRFQDKVVVVTGAARGQGRAMALGFAREGAAVAICDLASGAPTGTDYPLSGDADLESAAAEIAATGARVFAKACDVRNAADVDSFVAAAAEALGPPTILVNNAGILLGNTPVHETSDAAFDNIIAVNLAGVFKMSRAVVPHMIAAGGGRIVNISSAAGLVGSPMYAAYTASKHGVIGLTKSMAGEVAPHRITVNAVCPGMVPTTMVSYAATMFADQAGVPVEDVYTSYRQLQLLQEQITPEHTTAVVMFLADEDRITVTGVAIPVDGGWVAT